MNLYDDNSKTHWAGATAMASPSAGAIVLAAGESRRLGSPKALVQVGAYPLIWWACHMLKKAGCSPIVVVVNQAILSEANAWLPDTNVVVNPAPELGRTGSLQCGLKALQEEHAGVERVVMAPIDRPGWNAGVVAGLLKHANSVCASWNGQNGHPVLLHHGALQQVLSASPSTPLRDVVSFAPVDLESPYLSLNIDTMEDVTHLMQIETQLLDYFSQGEEI
jgi:CTP:molybdopterin cytidylyltransferase MocA